MKKMITILFAVIVFAAPATAEANKHHRHHKHHASHAVRSAPVAPPVEQPCCGITQWTSPTWEEWSDEMEAAGFTPKETEEYWLETVNS